MMITVFVKEILQRQGEPTIIRASNGSKDGPPLLVFTTTDTQRYHIGQRISLTGEVDG